MGADIHLVLEQYNPTRNVWVGVHAFPYLSSGKVTPIAIVLSPPGEERQEIDRKIISWVNWPARSRNYRRFAALAGVRGDGPEARGLPEDASTLSLMHLDPENADLHSHTWYPILEATRIWMQTQHDDDLISTARQRLLEQQDTSEGWLREKAFELFGAEIDFEYAPAEHFRLCIAFDN